MPHSEPRFRTSVLVAAALAAALATTPAPARVLVEPERALGLAFGEGAVAERQTVFLTDAQVRRARELAGPGAEIPSALVTRFVAVRGGTRVGTAYLDAHVVRTLRQTVLVAVSPDGTISRIEILAFAEPDDYLPRAAWLEQFRGRSLDGELSTRRGIHGITGATLSANAITDAVRRILAIHVALEGDAP